MMALQNSNLESISLHFPFDLHGKVEMTITLLEKFTGVDWVNIAKAAGTGLVLVCLSGGILDMFLAGSFQNSFFLLLVGLVIAIWELPTLYIFIPQCSVVVEYAMSTLKLDIPAVRAFVYILLSFPFLRGSASCVVVGLALFACSILNVFAQVNIHSDLQDITAAEKGVAAAEAKEELLVKNKKQKKSENFGTF